MSANEERTELESRVKYLDAQISELTKDRATAKQRLAEMATDLKVGDRVTYEGANCVWELTAIKPSFGKEPKFFGSKIKKDGTPGLNIVNIWQVPYGKTLVKSDLNSTTQNVAQPRNKTRQEGNHANPHPEKTS